MDGLRELATATGDAPFTTFRLLERSEEVLVADQLGILNLLRLHNREQKHPDQVEGQHTGPRPSK
jgi:hypothetical protein